MRLSAAFCPRRVHPRHTGRLALGLVPLLALAGPGCFPDPGELQSKAPVSDSMAGAATNMDMRLSFDQQGTVDPPATGPNNTADLTMGDVGTKASPVASVRKRLPVNLLAALPQGLALGQAYGMHLFPTGKNLDTAIPVTNNGAQIWCGIHPSQVVYKDANGAALFKSADMNPVNGTVAAVGTLWTSTCLGPGETGYLLDIQ